MSSKKNAFSALREILQNTENIKKMVSMLPLFIILNAFVTVCSITILMISVTGAIDRAADKITDELHQEFTGTVYPIYEYNEYFEEGSIQHYYQNTERRKVKWL